MRRWVERLRRRGEERSALHAEAWLEVLGLLLEVSRASLRPNAVPENLIGLLHRIDWWLEHCRGSERALRRTLEERAPELSPRLRDATDQAIRLRNLMASFFIRWKAFQDAKNADKPTAYLDRREMEEALLDANRLSRELAARVDALAPTLRAALTRDPGHQQT